MLIRFKVANFLSFNEPQEFSMIAGKTRQKSNHVISDECIKLLRFSAIYGANASGKSNLVKAMSFARKTIVDKLPEGHTSFFCKNKDDNSGKNSYFEFEIKLNGKYYSYGFEVLLKESQFVSEWLIELSGTGKEKEIFSRDIVNGLYNIANGFDKEVKERLEVYAQDTEKDSTVLFLNVMNQNKDSLYDKYPEISIFKEVYSWFRVNLDINYPDEPISSYSYFMVRDNMAQITRIISSFGTGISDYKIVDLPIDKLGKSFPTSLIKKILADLENIKKNIPEDKEVGGGVLLRSDKNFYIFSIDKNGEISVKTIQFIHSNKNILFSLSEESDGTSRLLDLLEVLLTKEKEKVFVVDEIDRCLHPQLTYRLIDCFLNNVDESERQLIVTTHEAHLMDFDLLRRDEVWFVDKDKEGNSSIYSLEEFNARFDQKIDKAYLEGRYGGVPIFSTVFPMKENKDEN